MTSMDNMARFTENGKRIGRPPKYETPEQMQIVIDKYFKDCKKEMRPFTISGLAVALGMSREALLGYEKEPFLRTVKEAKAKVAQYIEELSLSGSNQAGCIFNLKNNFGFKDKQEVEVSGSVGLDKALIEGRQRLREEMEKNDG